MDNVIRYTPPGGRIDVTAHMAGTALTVSVSDTGPGIAAAERERVLERFYRGASVNVEGSGLGLAIAHEIALAHGGRIALDAATAAGGLRVRVTLPLVPGASA